MRREHNPRFLKFARLDDPDRRVKVVGNNPYSGKMGVLMNHVKPAKAGYYRVRLDSGEMVRAHLSCLHN